jgi:UDP-N-acetylglucosamine:LPS N-acetylglucosamine transferase
MKITLVCSSGGHLAQLHRLETWWRRYDRTWVTFRTPDAVSILRGEQVVWAFHPTTRNVSNLVRNLRLAWQVLKANRPHLVISDGAGVALPFFLVARILRIRTVYLEVYDRIDKPTLTGRLCYPLSDLFLLQWEEQRRAYPRGLVVGALL